MCHKKRGKSTEDVRCCTRASRKREKGELASSFLGVFGGDKEEENGAVRNKN
jgi:hypothetical protein